MEPPFAIFTNDNDTRIDLLDHEFSHVFSNRNNHEIFFRKIHSYLIKNKIIDGNIIDLGAWIGDNSLPWAKQIDHIVYAIDPSPKNINYIEEMSKYNNISNINTIQKPISDKLELVATNDNIDHCTFVDGGGTQLNAVSLDYLYNNNEIDNISFIHLDVEGFEFKVIKGSSKIIDTFNPIITFEQHLGVDNYLDASTYLSKRGYSVYLINEILPGCNVDCRNLIAFPKKYNINIKDIHESIAKEILLCVVGCNDKVYDSSFTATLYGSYFSSKTFSNVKSVMINKNLHVFSIYDDGYTKMVAIDGNKTWLGGKYIMGKINLACEETITNAFNSAQGIIDDKSLYNINNIRSSTLKTKGKKTI
jgi:FkbM family methyltransferase